MRQTIITLIIVVLAALFGWAWFKYVRAPTGQEAAAPLARQSQDEELNQYRRINNLKPDTEVLSNTIFKSLESAREEVPPGDIAKGRSNPFLPFSGSSPRPAESPARPRASPISTGSGSGLAPVAPLAPTAPGP